MCSDEKNQKPYHTKPPKLRSIPKIHNMKLLFSANNAAIPKINPIDEPLIKRRAIKGSAMKNNTITGNMREINAMSKPIMHDILGKTEYSTGLSLFASCSKNPFTEESCFAASFCISFFSIILYSLFVILVLLVFSSYFSSESLEFMKRYFSLFGFFDLIFRTCSRWHAVPFKFFLHKIHAFARNGVADENRWFFKHGLGFVTCVNDLADIVTIYFDHVPTECFVFFPKRIQGHHIFGEAVDLNIIAVNDID